MIASLTWPRTLPPGWSVEWDPTPANDDNADDVMYGLHHDILYRRLELILFPLQFEL